MREFTLEKTMAIRLMMLDDTSNRIDVKNFELTFSLATDSAMHEDIYTAQLDQNISFSKIAYFLQNVVDESFVSRKEQTSMGAPFSNNQMVLPDLNESILVTVLHAKLNSIANKYSVIDRLVLKDLDLQLSYAYTCTDLSDVSNLPTVKDWIGDLSLWPTAWWLRDDPFTYDACAKTPADFDTWKAMQSEGLGSDAHTDAFDSIETELRALFNKMAGVSPAEIIEVNFTEKKPARQKWVPQVID